MQPLGPKLRVLTPSCQSLGPKLKVLTPSCQPWLMFMYLHVHLGKREILRDVCVLMCCSSFRHSEDLIQRLENAGLGYHVDADKTVDKLGNSRVFKLEQTG